MTKPEDRDLEESAPETAAKTATPDDPRGRTATAPQHIPWRGWKDILRRVMKETRTDNLDLVAASVTFYATLALAPAFVAIVSIYGLLASPQDVSELLEPMFMLMPSGGGRMLVQDLLHTAVETAPTSLSFKAALAIALSLWSANRGMKALIIAVGLAYEEPERPSPIRENLRSLLFVVVAVLVLVLAVILLVALPALTRGSLIGEGVAWFVTIVRWPVLFVVVMVGLSGLYRWAPSRRSPRWRWVSVGSVSGTLLWLLFSGGIALYSYLAGETRTGHEALDGMIAMLLWFYASSYAILLGAELNSEIEHQTAVDSTVGEPRPLGERNAYVADNVAGVDRDGDEPSPGELDHAQLVAAIELNGQQ